MIGEHGQGGKLSRAERRRRRRRQGLVCYFGVETLGFEGEATTITEGAGCPACLAAGVASHPECQVTPALARLFARGEVEALRRDGEWIAVLTPGGVQAFGELDRRRRAR